MRRLYKRLTAIGPAPVFGSVDSAIRKQLLGRICIGRQKQGEEDNGKQREARHTEEVEWSKGH